MRLKCIYLNISPCGQISSLDIGTALPPSINVQPEEMEQYLTLLTDHKVGMHCIYPAFYDQCLMSYHQVKVLYRCGDSGGGTYSISKLIKEVTVGICT